MMVDKLVMLKPIEYTIPRLSSHVSYGLVLMVCQSRFLTHNKCTILVGDVDNSKIYVYGISYSTQETKWESAMALLGFTTQ